MYDYDEHLESLKLLKHINNIWTKLSKKEKKAIFDIVIKSIKRMERETFNKQLF